MQGSGNYGNLQLNHSPHGSGSHEHMSADDSPEDDGGGRSARAKKGSAAAANTKTKRNARQQDQNKQARACFGSLLHAREGLAPWCCGAATHAHAACISWPPQPCEVWGTGVWCASPCGGCRFGSMSRLRRTECEPSMLACMEKGSRPHDQAVSGCGVTALCKA